MAESKKRSAARAKPAREAAGSVRYGGNVNVSSDNASKKAYAAERLKKKTDRQKRTRDEDRIYAVSDILLEDSEEFQAKRKVWRWLMGLSIAMIVLTIVFGQIAPRIAEGQTQNVLTFLTTATLVLGYAFIIATFVYDMVKMRPLRAEYDSRVRSMTDKKQQQILAEHEEAAAEERRAKREAKKAAKAK